jgi:hypothetical protein
MAALVADYEATSVAWIASLGSAKREHRFTNENRLQRRLRRIAAKLVMDDAGRRELVKLMGHPNVTVRALAACELMESAPSDEALAVLEDIADGSGEMAQAAHQTLIDFGRRLPD